MPSEITQVLVDIGERKKRQALIRAEGAVVASVATAYPHASGEALLVLLSAPDYITFDRGRVAGERQASALSGMLPQLRVDNKVYEEERKDADGRLHRRFDLELAITNLQVGPLAQRVHDILDRYRAEMRPADEQDEEDLIWRLALHRMDLRQYTVAEHAPKFEK